MSAAAYGALRLFVGVVLRSVYRLDVAGREKVPADGPALLVANHVSFIDTLLIGLLARRPVRFVMHKKYYELPIAHVLFRALGCIPIASARRDPRCLEQALDRVDIALANNEVVCVFPEGSLTRDGTLGRFRPGVERMVARRPVPVIPIALTGLWRSVFSRNPHARGLSRALDRIGVRVGVVAGDPIPAHECTGERLKREVFQLASNKLAS